MVCPRRQHEDEAEDTDDTSERHHLDSVEMSRLCTDWPRTLDQQRAKAYIALVLAPCSPRLTMFVHFSSAAPSLHCCSSSRPRVTASRTSAFCAEDALPRMPLASGVCPAASWCRGSKVGGAAVLQL